MVTDEGPFCAMSAASQVRSVHQLEQSAKFPFIAPMDSLTKWWCVVVPFDWRVKGLADLFQTEENTGILR